MLIVISIAMLLVSSIICIRIGEIKKWIKLSSLGAGVLSISAYALIVCAIASVGTEVRENVEYEKMYEDKLFYESAYEQLIDERSREILNCRIAEFNNTLRSKKKWANSLWTNLFVNQKIANEIDYIEGAEE